MADMPDTAGEQPASPSVPQFQATADVQVSQEAIDQISQHTLRLSESFLELTGSLRQAVGDSMGNTLEHLLVQESAAERVQGAANQSVESGNQLVHSVAKLNRSLRGLDLLAEQVKGVRVAVDELEKQVNVLLATSAPV